MSKAKRTKSARRTTAPDDDADAAASLNDETWKSFVFTVNCHGLYAEKYAKAAMELMKRGTRRRFVLIDLSQLLEEAEIVAQAKGKPKETALAPLASLYAEASAQMADDNGEFPATVAAQIIRIKLAMRKDEDLERRNADNLDDEDTAAQAKTPKPGKKKATGKGQADAADTPGKRKLDMKTRAEEASHIDFIDDEPADGPDTYCCIHGFGPALISALAEKNIPVNMILTITSADDDVSDNEDGVNVTGIQAKIKSAVKYIHSVREKAADMVYTHPLQNIAWKTVGLGAAPSPPDSFTNIASTVYSTLTDQNNYSEYLTSNTFSPLDDPDSSAIPLMESYSKALEEIPLANQSIALILDTMTTAVSQLLDSDCEQQLEAECPKISVQLSQLLDWKLRSNDSNSESGSLGKQGPVAVVRFHDYVTRLSHYLSDQLANKIKKANYDVLLASRFKQLWNLLPEERPYLREDADKTLTQLACYSELTNSEVERYLQLLHFELLLAEATGASPNDWNLSGYTVFEELDEFSCLQAFVMSCREGFCKIATQYYPDHDCVLVCLLPVSVNKEPLPWRAFTHTPVGLTDYLEYTIDNAHQLGSSTAGVQLENQLMIINGTDSTFLCDNCIMSTTDFKFAKRPQQKSWCLQRGAFSFQVHVLDQVMLPGEDLRNQKSVVVTCDEGQLVLTSTDLTKLCTQGKCEWVPTDEQQPEEYDLPASTSAPESAKRTKSGSKERPKSSMKKKKPAKDPVEQPVETPEVAPDNIVPPSPLQAFVLIPREELFNASFSTDDGLSIRFTPKGIYLRRIHEMFSQPCQSFLRKAAAQEEWRLIRPNAEVVRCLTSGRGHEVMCPNGDSYILSTQTQHQVHSLAGQDVVYDNLGSVIQSSDVNVVRRTAYPENVQVLVHPEGTIGVGKLESSHCVEFKDGTRIESEHKIDESLSFSIQCIGFPKVLVYEGVFTTQISNLRMSYSPKDGTLDVQTANSSEAVSLRADGTALISLNSTVPTSTAIKYDINLFDGSITQQDKKVTSTLEQPSQLQYQCDSSDFATVCRPKLLILRRDGTSRIYLHEQDAAAFAKNHQDSAITRSHDSDSVTTTTFATELPPWNPYNRDYSAPSPLPLSLQRRVSPNEQWSYGKNQLFVRQLCWFEGLDDTRRAALSEAFEQRIEWQTCTKNYHKPCGSKEDGTSNSDLMSQLILLDDDELVESYAKLKTPDSTTISQPSRTADVVVEAAETQRMSTLKKELLLGHIPGYFETIDITERLRQASELTNIATASLPAADEGAHTSHLNALTKPARSQEQPASPVQKIDATSLEQVLDLTENPALDVEMEASDKRAITSAEPMRVSPELLAPREAGEVVANPAFSSRTRQPGNESHIMDAPESLRTTLTKHDLAFTLGDPKFRDISRSARDINISMDDDSIDGDLTQIEVPRATPETTQGAMPLPPIGANIPVESTSTTIGEPMNYEVEVFPPEATFGTLKENCGYCLTIKIRNRGSVPCQYHISQPVSEHLLIVHRPGKIASGADAKVEVQLNASKPCEIVETLKIETDFGDYMLPVHALVLSKQIFESRKVSATNRGPGVRLMSTRPISVSSSNLG